MLLDRLAAVTYKRWLEDAPAVIAIDSETEGVGFYDRPFCFTFTWRRPNGELRNGYIELEDDQSSERVSRILMGSDTWIFHNAKFDLQKILLEHLVPRDRLDAVTIHDTEAIWHLLNNTDRKGLKYLAGQYLGQENREPEKKLAKVRRKLGIKKADGYLYLPREFVVPYAMKDTEMTYSLAVLGLPRLKKQGLLELYQAEMELCVYMLDMEIRGMRLDVAYCERMAAEYGSKIMATLGEIRSLVGQDDFNPASVPQLKTAFAERGLRLDSTDEDHLLPLDDELAQLVLAYRQLMKMHKTYFVALLAEQRDGLVHPSFRQHGARTGRMSSGKAEQ